MTVTCMRPGCDRTWPRDPVLEVACPDCGARVGTRCRRPSGHTAWGEANFHAARDTAADQAGCYGQCPLGLCGLAAVRRRQAGAALPLLAYAGLTNGLSSPDGAAEAGLEGTDRGPLDGDCKRDGGC
jgi:hypothetical protein